MKIEVNPITGSYAVTASEGQQVYDLVNAALHTGEPVALDFSTVYACSSTFLGVAIAQLLKEYPPETLNERLTIENMSPYIREVLKIAIANFKKQMAE
jgi:hypothetical protein